MVSNGRYFIKINSRSQSTTLELKCSSVQKTFYSNIIKRLVELIHYSLLLKKYMILLIPNTMYIDIYERLV